MTRSLTLRAPRLRVRMLDRGDVTEFTRYRNLEAVARYQDWPLPYTRDLAHELVDAMEACKTPTAGQWVQMAIDVENSIVGDVAVWLDETSDLAMIGYTIAPEHQGAGYATEAVAAIVDYLFKRRRVHRIAATIDPRNLASARVLERCGFEYVGTARSAAFSRGEWTDDARFSLLAPDWKAWKERDTEPPERVDFIEIQYDSFPAVAAIDRSFSQRPHVSSVMASLAEARIPEYIDGELVVPWYRAITADGTIVGFIMVAEPHPGQPHPFLWRLIVDRRQQGRSIGTQAIMQLAETLQASGASQLDVSFVAGTPGNPQPFYERLGFVPTGEIKNGETLAALDLTRLPWVKSS